jgi:hypothetical protein
MQKPKRPLILSFLAALCLLIHLFSRDPLRAENRYFQAFFVPFSLNLRRFFGVFSFSLGDIIYGLALAILIIWIILLIFKIAHPKYAGNRQRLLNAGYRILISAMSLYLLFNIFWGINYNRSGIAGQLHLEVKKMSRADLLSLNEMLLDSVNASRHQVDSLSVSVPRTNDLFQRAGFAYGKLADRWSFLNYERFSVKSTSYSTLLNYAGFTGYYNPFTGEAQVNTSIPSFLQPFTTCHEIAHQLGYAKEMEANFVGYLAARASGDPVFTYSAYLELFLYANRDLWYADSTQALEYRHRLSIPVMYDLELWKAFRKKNESMLAPVTEFVYDFFLRRNQQPQGLDSYARVTMLLNAYYKKYGML